MFSLEIFTDEKVYATRLKYRTKPNISSWAFLKILK